tara:strand:+ start:664 stop:867 length:204 start_codon:yes stop_codon:yes gene_type:complete
MEMRKAILGIQTMEIAKLQKNAKNDLNGQLYVNNVIFKLLENLLINALLGPNALALCACHVRCPLVP